MEEVSYSFSCYSKKMMICFRRMRMRFYDFIEEEEDDDDLLQTLEEEDSKKMMICFRRMRMRFHDFIEEEEEE
jgi:hypothetical protein